MSTALSELVEAVRRDGIDLTRLALAPLLRKSLIPAGDLETLSENVLHAAVLIQLKIGQLLPALPCPPIEAENPGAVRPPRLEPAQLHAATRHLHERLSRPTAVARPSEPEPDPAPPAHLNLLDVLRLAREALATARAHQDLDVENAAHKIEDMIRILEAALEAAGPAAIDLQSLLDAQRDPLQRISLFLAVLELVKETRLRIEQENTFSSIALYRHTRP